MIEGKTRTGFKFKIDERIGTDWRVISSIALAESPNPSDQIKGSTQLVKLLLGDSEEAFMNHVAKKNDGFIPVNAVISELTDIITSTKETKN